MVIDGHNQSVSNRLTIKKKIPAMVKQKPWLSSSLAVPFRICSSWSSASISPYLLSPQLLHQLFPCPLSRHLQKYPLMPSSFFFFHSNSISSIICLIRKYIHCFNTSPNHLHVTSLHSSTLTLPLTCSFLIQSIDQSQHFHLLQLRPRILSIRHSHCL